MSQESREAALKRRKTRAVVSALILLAAALVLLRVLIVPDPSGHLLFARAKRLENSGLVQPALRQYLLLADSYPKSDLAPQALWNAADLQTDLATAGQPNEFLAARITYLRLADNYFGSPLAPAALLNAGDLSLDPLHDFPAARSAFERVLREYSQRQDEAGARATLGLGRVAQGTEERDAAKRWYERVLSRYKNYNELCAQAQYRLGETYEMLFRDRPTWARAAYRKTIEIYPGSAWASQAKERLGLLLYAAPPRERRVIVEAKALAGADSESATSRLAALQMVLRVRGVNASQTLMDGLTLTPFYAGFRADTPASAVRVSLDDFDNAVANAGLLYETEDGGDITSAARTLQREVDAGHATLIFTGRWQFVAGYDSSRGEVTLQDGARLVTQTLAQLAPNWKKRVSGGAFSVLSFHAPGETAQSRILPPGAKKQSGAALVATPPTKNGAGAMSKGVPHSPDSSAATPVAASTRAPQKPRATPTPQSFAPQLSPLSPPTYVVTLAPLDESAMYRRVARGAANALRRARSGDAYLNLEALQVLSDALQRAADSALSAQESTGEIPEKFATPAPTEAPVRQQDAPADNALEPMNFSANEFAAGKNRRPAPTASSSFMPTRDAAFFLKTASTRTHTATSLAAKQNTFSPQKTPFRKEFSRRRRGVQTRLSTIHRADFVASTRNALFVAQIEPLPAPTIDATATPEAPPPTDGNAVTPRDETRAKPSRNAAQLRSLANWRGAASRQWSVSRRAAAAFCDEAAARTGDSAFSSAAEFFRESARDLESAAASLPAGESREYSRAAFESAARFVASALDAEKRATQFLAKAGA